MFVRYLLNAENENTLKMVEIGLLTAIIILTVPLLCLYVEQLI